MSPPTRTECRTEDSRLARVGKITGVFYPRGASSSGMGLASSPPRAAAMRLISSVLVVMLLSATNVVAKPKHWHQDKRPPAEPCSFEDREVRIIREYYQPRYRSLPPGLAKKLYRTGHLPPGWERRMEPLPVVVRRQLAVRPAARGPGCTD